ncbi:Hsp20/alpha crystallin family protein [Luteolibacter sp. AS25]|uniref:Hsp20/alpha crystallin family protein n=1 Tax=Luteolibacter sp. AS25 TaxID=3135776 RepID=UPI00398B7244
MSTITTWNPYHELERIQDRVFRAIHQTGEEGKTLLNQADWTPAVEISEDEKQYSIAADLPQIAREDVKVIVDNGSLVIKGERVREELSEGKKVHRTERSYGKFHRSFTLPEDADGSGVTANFKEGVLIVNLPKSEEKKPKHIEVQVG